MINGISPQLEGRLTRLASRRNCSLETLLTDLADQAEDADRLNFPANPFRFIEIAVTLIAVTDLDGNFLYANPGFYRTLGYTPADVLHQPFDRFIHPDDLPLILDRFAAALAGADVTHLEHRFRCRDGSYRWLSWVASTTGKQIYAVALDITDQKQAQFDREEAIRQMDRVLASIFDGYLLGDAAGRLLDVNQNYCTMLGYTREELLQMTVFDLDATIAAPKISGNAREILDDDISLVLETRHRCKDGSLVDVEINSVKLKNGQIACFMRDITGRKRLERDLRHSEQLYRGIIESQIDLVARYTPDATLTYINDAYCRYFNYPRERLIGQRFLDLIPVLEPASIEHRLNAIIGNPAPEVSITRSLDPQGKAHWIQWVDFGITDDQGDVVEIQAVGRDITDLIETRNRLTEREEMLSMILDTMPILLIQYDHAGHYVYTNRHFVETLGWTAPEMEAHPDILAEIYPDPAYRAEVLAFMRSLAPGWRDFKTCARDGTVIDISWANMRLSTGHTLGIGQVITHRVELENQRVYAHQLELELEKERELRDLKDRFASWISHEFRTPLTVISTSVETILRYRERLTPEQINTRLILVQQQVREMVELMEDTLNYNRSIAGKMDIKPGIIQLPEFCEKVIDVMRLTSLVHSPADVAHSESPVRPRLILDCEPGILYADPRLLEHILMNLLSNGLKYSPATSTVTLKVTRPPSAWQFVVTDEGIGIPEADLPRVFEPFHRARNTGAIPGTGLGLSIVKQYVELQGGTVTVSSTVNVGSIFTVTLPPHP